VPISCCGPGSILLLVSNSALPSGAALFVAAAVVASLLWMQRCHFDSGTPSTTDTAIFEKSLLNPERYAQTRPHTHSEVQQSIAQLLQLSHTSKVLPAPKHSHHSPDALICFGSMQHLLDTTSSTIPTAAYQLLLHGAWRHLANMPDCCFVLLCMFAGLKECQARRKFLPTCIVPTAVHLDGMPYFVLLALKHCHFNVNGCGSCGILRQ